MPRGSPGIRHVRHDREMGIGPVKLTFIRKTALSQLNNCPSLYRTDRGTFVVQGWRVSDPEALAQLDIPAHETVVEVPADVLAEIAKAL